MSILFTISKVTVSYQYVCSLSYRKINLLRFIADIVLCVNLTVRVNHTKQERQ